MDGIVVLGFLLLIGLFLGAIFGWIAFFQMRDLRQQVQTLTENINQQQSPTEKTAALSTTKVEWPSTASQAAVKDPTSLSAPPPKKPPVRYRLNGTLRPQRPLLLLQETQPRL